MDEVSLSVATWIRFVTWDFVISPDLIGAELLFEYKQHQVIIRLPSSENIPLEPGSGEFLSFNSYREVNGKKKPIEFWVHSVETIILVPDDILIPKDILAKPPNAYEIISDSKQQELNKLTGKYEKIANDAFAVWIRTLRWKGNNSAINRPRIVGSASGWSTYIVTQTSGQRIWAQPSMFKVPSVKAVTVDIWKETESSLRNGINPPIYNELLFDGIEHFKLGDLQRAVVDLAMACEAYIRLLVNSSLPLDLQESFKQYIDEANIRPVMTRFLPNIFSETENDQLKCFIKRLHKLFDFRNVILHTGRKEDITSKDLEGLR